MCQRCHGPEAHTVGTVTLRDINGIVIDESEMCLECMTPVARVADLSMVPLIAGLEMDQELDLEGAIA